MSTPLGITVWGFLLAFVDLRFNGFDVLPDPAGWLLAAIGLAALGSRAVGFRVAMVVAGIEVAMSLPLVVAAELPDPWGTVETLLQTASVFSVCTGLVHVLAHLPDRAREAEIIRWTDLALTVLLVPITAAFGQGATGGSTETLLVVPLALVGFGIGVWFVVLLFRVRDDPAVGGRTGVPV